MNTVRLAVAVILIVATPGAALAECVKSRGTPLRSDDEITLEYMRCRNAQQVEALKDQGPVRLPPQDKLRVDQGALADVKRGSATYDANRQKMRQSLSSMADVNTRMSDELRLLRPRRLP